MVIFKSMRFTFRKKEKTEERKIRYILTIDGGGMRGIVPAFILEKMNDFLKEKTERPLYSYFDLVAGTSTGALIALGLTSPTEDTHFTKEEGDEYKVEKTVTTGRIFRKQHTETDGFVERTADPDNFVDLYRKNGKNIFLKKEVKGLRKLVDKVSRLFSDKYEIEPYEEFLSTMYGETELSEALVPTMAVAFNADGGHEYIFRSWDSHDYLVREAARASSAAPTYFAPAKFIDRKTDEELTLLDGGIIANNPVLTAYIEARKLYPDADEYRILSLSTASTVLRMDIDEFSSNLDWMGPLLSAYGAANMNISLETAESIKGVKILRVWKDVLKTHIPLDDTSDEAVNTLLEAAEEIWENQKDEIKAFLTTMVDNDGLPQKLKLRRENDAQPSIEERKEESLALPSL